MAISQKNRLEYLRETGVGVPDRHQRNPGYLLLVVKASDQPCTAYYIRRVGGKVGMCQYCKYRDAYKFSRNQKVLTTSLRGDGREKLSKSRYVISVDVVEKGGGGWQGGLGEVYFDSGVGFTPSPRTD